MRRGLAFLSVVGCGPATGEPADEATSAGEASTSAPASTSTTDTTGTTSTTSTSAATSTSSADATSAGDTAVDETSTMPGCDIGGPMDGFTGDGILMDLAEGDMFFPLQWAEEDGHFASCTIDGGRLDLRFAPSSADDGCAIEFLICGYEGTIASFATGDPSERCGTRPSATIWWHGASDVYASAPNDDATPCRVLIEPRGDFITGEVVCAQLVGTMGETAIILQGAFGCTPRGPE